MIRSIFTPAALLCLAAAAFAQQTPGKVGVISVQGAIVGTKDGQKASQELDAKFSPRQKEFEARNTEVRQLEDQLSKGGNLMSEEKRTQVARDIDEKKRRLDRDGQDAREELNTEQQKLIQGIGQRIMAVIEKYAKDNGYTLILDVSNQNTPVLYASSGIDITQDIIALYDKSSVGGAPASMPSTPATPAPGAAIKPKP